MLIGAIALAACGILLLKGANEVQASDTDDEFFHIDGPQTPQVGRDDTWGFRLEIGTTSGAWSNSGADPY